MERTNLIKELSIARQSGIKIALEFCKVHGIKPTMRQLLKLTDLFAEDCLLSPDDDFNERVKKTDEWVKDRS
jgi:hypothetical protein